MGCGARCANFILPMRHRPLKGHDMSSKDDKNLTQVIDKISSMEEPRRSGVRRVHDIIVVAAPALKPRIWYGMPAMRCRRARPHS